MTPADVQARIAERLGARGIAVPACTLPDTLRPVEEDVPDWWLPRGNLLLVAPGAAKPGLGLTGDAPPSGAVIAVAATTPPAAILLSGDAPLVAFGQGVHLPSAWLACGDAATIVVGDRTGCTFDGRIDARNGGVVSIGEDGLWASRVMVNSDHMHAIRDLATGRRLNPFGGVVEVARHVWLGHEAILMPGARIGADTVVGARSFVSRPLPPNTVCVGSPARVVREGVTWSFEDLP